MGGWMPDYSGAGSPGGGGVSLIANSSTLPGAMNPSLQFGRYSSAVQGGGSSTATAPGAPVMLSQHPGDYFTAGGPNASTSGVPAGTRGVVAPGMTGGVAQLLSATLSSIQGTASSVTTSAAAATAVSLASGLIGGPQDKGTTPGTPTGTTAGASGAFYPYEAEGLAGGSSGAGTSATSPGAGGEGADSSTAAGTGGLGERWRPRGVLMAHLMEHRKAVTRLAVAGGGGFAVSGSADETVKVGDSAGPETKVLISGLSDPCQLLHQL
jgi:hypothetical protein